MAPQYYVAYSYFSVSNYDLALEELQDVVFSGVPCNISARAGALMARAFIHKNDYIGAQLTLDVLDNLYPEHAKNNRNISRMREIVDVYGQKIDEDKLAALMIEYFGTQLAQAREKIDAGMQLVAADPTHLSSN